VRVKCRASLHAFSIGGGEVKAHRSFKPTAKQQVSFVLGSILLVLASPAAWGQFQSFTASAAGRTNLSPAEQKIRLSVLNTIAAIRATGPDRFNTLRTTQARVSPTTNPLIAVDDLDRIQLYIQLSEVTPAALEALESGGAQTELMNDNLKIVQAWVPYDEVETIAALDFVARIRPPDYATRQVGSRTTLGDSILKADVARSTLGFTGAGVKIGVISDGARDVRSAQATGDLPSSIRIFGSCRESASDCNEGTALMEIIYDLAPGATLGFGAVSTSLEFVARVDQLKSWGAKVIVDDLAFFGEPFFEDGPVALAYADALAQGIVLISAAGNEGRTHYQQPYLDSNGFHNFTPGGTDLTLRFSGESLSEPLIVLQWSSQFGASTDDYDLCVVQDDGGEIGCSRNRQDGTQDPVEALGLFCPSFFFNCVGNIKIQRISGSGQTLELFLLGMLPGQAMNDGDAVVGHADVPGVISVGAIAANDPGNLLIEPASSRGPSTITFPAPEQRATPVVTAVDCVAVTGAGEFPRNFCGTSAAAAHVAGVVALLLEARPQLTPAQVKDILQRTAADRGAPGYDYMFGSGLVNALEAVLGAIANPTPAISSISPSSVPRGAAAFTLTVNGRLSGIYSCRERLRFCSRESSALERHGARDCVCQQQPDERCHCFERPCHGGTERGDCYHCGAGRWNNHCTIAASDRALDWSRRGDKQRQFPRSEPGGWFDCGDLWD
jgi:hypothetical protein